MKKHFGALSKHDRRAKSSLPKVIEPVKLQVETCFASRQARYALSEVDRLEIDHQKL